MATTYNVYHQTSPGVIKPKDGVKNWAQLKIYEAGSQVLSDNTVFTCVKAHTSGDTFSNDNWIPTKVKGLTSTSFTLDSLDPTKKYYIAISSTVDNVESVATKEVSISPIDSSIPLGVKAEFNPLIPGDLKISWDGVKVNGVNATGYNIYYSVIPAFVKEQAIKITVDTNQYLFTDIDRTSKFYFMVTANYLDGTTPLEGAPSAMTETTDKSIPQNVVATPDATSITFTWDPVILNNKFPEEYIIKLGNSRANAISETPLKEVAASGISVSATIDGLTEDTTYFYSIAVKYKDATEQITFSPVLVVPQVTTATTA